MIVVIFDCNDYDSGHRFVVTDGWSIEGIEVLLRAEYPEGKIMAVVRDAEWRSSPSLWLEYADMDHFATSPSWEAFCERKWNNGEYRLMSEERQQGERAQRAANLEAFVKLPAAFVDHVVGWWETWLKEHPNWNSGEPRVDEQERLAIIKAAVAAQRVGST